MIERIILFCMLFIGCSPETGNKQGIKGIILRWSLPSVESKNGKIHEMNDSLYIFYKNDITFIRIPIQTTTYNKNAFENDTLVFSDDKKSILETYVKYRNFLYKENDKSGLKLGEIGTEKAEIFDVDSLLKSKAFKGAHLYGFESDRFIKTTTTGKITIDHFFCDVKPDASFSDSTYYYYSKGYDDIAYSLSEKADSDKKMKLIRVDFVYNPFIDKITKRQIPKRVISISIKKIILRDTTKIASYFDNFTKAYEMMPDKN